MKFKESIEGRWWIFGPKKTPHYGILTYNPEVGLTLTVKVARPKRLSILFEQNQNDRLTPKVIWGCDKHDRPVTLFGCMPGNTSGADGLLEVRIRPFYCVTEGHWKSLDQVTTKYAQAELSLLNNWTGRRAIHELPGTGIYRPVKAEIPDDIVIPLDAGSNLKIRTFVSTKSGYSEYELKQKHYAVFEFSEPIAFSTIHSKYILVLRRLLVLLTGRLVYTDTISLSNASERGRDHEVFFANKGVTQADRGTLSFEMLASMEDLGADCVKIIQQWFRYHQQLDSVLSLYFATVQNRHLYSNHQFLFLAQALEVYHSTNEAFTSSISSSAEFRKRIKELTSGLAKKSDVAWLKKALQHANQKTLAQRIEEILERNNPETKQLIPQPNKFAAFVRHTRNYYTHYGKNLKDSDKIAEGMTLIKINLQMRALIEICILKDLGISGPPLDRIISNFKRTKFTKAG